MCLRSCFDLSADGDEEWHRSERGEIQVSFDSDSGDGVGKLTLKVPDGSIVLLVFIFDGSFNINGNQVGRWRFCDDSSIELSLVEDDGTMVQERICFTRPNLRLRSTTLVDCNGTPKKGSFSTDIRRVSNSSV